jgi:hypothetical protein
MEGERSNTATVTQLPQGNTMADDLEFEWLVMRASAFQDWQRRSMAVLENQITSDTAERIER